jgi:hypothetical protein
METTFVKVFYKNGTEELFELGKKGVNKIGFDPLIIYFDDDGRTWRKVINENEMLNYETNF